MGLFLDIISLVGSAASISGVSLKNLLGKTPPPPPNDRTEIQQYISYLEGRNVLLAGMDDEVQVAVIRSLEQIKQETEDLRQRCNDEQVRTVLLSLLLTMSKELQKLHGIDATVPQGQYKMYLALQGIRLEIAKTLALFCAAYRIDPRDSRLKEFILSFAVRPRR